MGRLAGKVAIVTGASKGIGSGIATAIAAEGARVVVSYSSDRTGAKTVVREIGRRGGKAIAVGADVSKAAEVAILFAQADEAFGRIDVLLNNAGVYHFGPFTEQAFHTPYNINVLGPILTVQETIKRFGPEGGSIVNISSIVASHPVAGVLFTRPRRCDRNVDQGLGARVGAKEDSSERNFSRAHRDRRACHGPELSKAQREPP